MGSRGSGARHGQAVDGPAPTALHLAAGAGRASIVERLLAAGADTTVRDPTFASTPAEWAQWFRHHDLAARLGAERPDESPRLR